MATQPAGTTQRVSQTVALKNLQEAVSKQKAVNDASAQAAREIAAGRQKAAGSSVGPSNTGG